MSLLDKFVGIIRGDRTVKSVREKGHVLTITENTGDRSLKFNGVTYSRISNSNIYTGSYWDYFSPLPALFEKPSILMIGLGGGTIVYQLKKIYGDDLDMKIVEISDKMIKLASEFLDYKFKSGEVIVGDGAAAVSAERKKYDLIILDAYEETFIPPVFLKEKFVRDSFKALEDDGILAINYALSAKNMVHYNKYLHLLGKLFKVYKVSGGNLLGNVIIICSKKMDKDAINSGIHSKYINDGGNRHIVDGYMYMR